MLHTFSPYKKAKCKLILLYLYKTFTTINFRPVAVLPTSKQNTIAVRCCPILFELRPDGPAPLITLPYRIIIAIATDSDVILYDTQQQAPFAHLQKIHYTRLTDLTWSSDGLILACSSTDGFCTLVTFSPNELGVQYKEPEIVIETVPIVEVEEKEIVEPTQKEPEIEIKPKKPNLLEQWTFKSPKTPISNKNRKQLINEKSNKIPVSNCIEITDSPEKSNETTEKKPKRIVPIRIGECKTPKKKKMSNNVTVISDSKVIGSTAVPEKNSLLTFLKTPNKNSEIKNIIRAEVETEARDSWNCEEKITTTTTPTIDDNMDSTIEIPEDFKLEITNSSINEDVSRISNADEVMDVDNNPVVSNEDRENRQTETEDKEITTKEHVNSASKDNLIPCDTTATKPKGRRVPLTTLSGPKRKKNDT